MGFKPACLTTAIGSLPFTDPRKAVKFVRNYLPEIPHWPQLPRTNETEGFVYQYLAPLVKIGMIKTAGHKIYIDTTQHNWDQLLTEFYTLYFAVEQGSTDALAEFAFPQASAAGFYAFLQDIAHEGLKEEKGLKGQISGPLTVNLTLTDQDRRAAYYHPEVRDVLIKALALQGKWQAQMLKRFGTEVIVFIDDPSLYTFGTSNYITLSRTDIVTDLSSIIAALRSEGAIVGVHSCAGMDWTLLFEAGVDIVSFDAFEYFNSLILYGKELVDYLNNGGVLAWGIVPTSEKVLGENVNSLSDLFLRQVGAVVEKGIKKDQLLSQVLLTPSCGTGSLAPEVAEKIYQDLNALGQLLRY